MKKLVAFRLSEEAINLLNKQDNKSAYIETLLVGGVKSGENSNNLLLNGLISDIQDLNRKIDLLINRADSKDLLINNTPPIETPPCCLLPNPCKHWTYNGITEQWVNSITGKVKQP